MLTHESQLPLQKRLNDVYADAVLPPFLQNQQFSKQQNMAAWSFIEESANILKELCRQVRHNIRIKDTLRHILITCCDIVDMMKNIPSVSKHNETLNMCDVCCDSLIRLSKHMDAYDVDPNNVTYDMIQSDCAAIAHC